MYLEVKVIVRRPSFTNVMTKLFNSDAGLFYGCKERECRNEFRCKEID